MPAGPGMTLKSAASLPATWGRQLGTELHHNADSSVLGRPDVSESAPLPPEIVMALERELGIVSDDRPGSPDMTVESDPEASPAPDLVSVRNVIKTFGGKQALNGVSFSVPQGQICGLLGPNGAGKTTLFRLLMGILKATSGNILVDGMDAFENRVETKRLIGFLPDEPVFYSYLSARETLELSAAMHGLDVAATMKRISPVVGQLRLTADMDNFADDFSRGMKKKLGLLLAMLHQPKLLILDEPTNGLDVESTHLFYDLIEDLARRGTTVLFSTHLMDHVARLCSHVVIINEGAVIAKGSLVEIRAAHAEASLEDIFLELTHRPRLP
jgi:ABC-type multidrug transport system ATPase subunit